MGLLRNKAERQSKLVKLGQLQRNAKKFELFDTAYRFESIQNKLVELNHVEDKKAKAAEILTAVDETKVTLEREHANRKIEKRVKFRSRRGLAVAAGLFGCMAWVGHMLYNPPAFIRSLPPRIGDNFHLIATGVIITLAVLIPYRDFSFTRRFNTVRIEGEKLLVRLKSEIEDAIRRNGST